MKFPISMLRDFVTTSLNAEEVGDLLTMAGFELEGIEEVEGEAVLDIKVVSNRGDGLSVFGLAREVLAKDATSQPTELYNRAAARFPAEDTDHADIRAKAAVSVETTDCTRYACRVMEVKNGESPEWLQKRIRQAGWRPLGVVVDVTNYVMLELGQPLHAFDQMTLREGRIVVRKARAGEKLRTLNDVEHKLNGDQMMICDALKPVAAAGIMGGAATEVSADTTNVLLESAHFVNTSVRRTRKQMGLSTEASYRFERSVDPEGVVAALNRCVELLKDCGGLVNLTPGVIDVYQTPPTVATLNLRMSRCLRLLGMEVSADEAKTYLQRLGFGVEGDGEPFKVTVPTWRPDIVREDDLIEEVGRVHGFDRIPETLPHGATTQGGLPPVEAAIDRLRARVLAAGFSQAVSHTLRDLHPLDAAGERVGPRHPGSPEIAWLRNSVLTSLADAAKRNGGKDIHLFEAGRIFTPDERRTLGLLSQGELFPAHRSSESFPKADFFSLKGLIDELVPGLEWSTPVQPDPRLHPTRQAVVVGLGFAGVLHPDVAEACGLPADTVVAELDLIALAERLNQPFAYKPISRNPAVRRDLAILIDKSVPFSDVLAAIERGAGDMLERHWLFDVYEGKGIPEGKHSLAVALTLRKMGENFTDEEANQVREQVVQELGALGATLR